MTLRVHPDEIVSERNDPLLAKHPTWDRVRIREIASIQNGFPFPSDAFNASGSGVPLIRIRDVGKESTETYYSGQVPDGYWVEHGEFIIGMDGDFRLAAWGGKRALLNQRVCRLTVRDSEVYDPRFLFYVLPGYLYAIHARTSSVTVKHLSSKTIAEIPVPRPPIEEQHRIVAAIEEQFSRLDAGVASLQRAARNLARMRAAVLQELATGERVASTVAVQDILLEPLANGRSVPDAADGFPVLRLTAIRNGRVDLQQRKIGAWTAEMAMPFLVREGDFLVVRGNGSLHLVGRGGRVPPQPDAVAFPDTLIRLRPNPALMDPVFLGLVWDSPYMRQQVEGVARTTAGIHKINQRDICRLRLPRPPVEVQRELATESERTLSLVDSLAAAISAALMRASSLRQAILTEAFSGRLVPQDPAEEPAAVLADRARPFTADMRQLALEEVPAR